jgi:xylulokinase
MFLGIDLGTSELKLLLLDDDQRIHASVSEPLGLQRPAPLHCEQDPKAWWSALERAVAQLRAQEPASWARIRGIGLSGQMHGAVLLDSAEQLLRPAILWNDGRSGAECGELLELVPDLHQRTGNLAMPGFTAPKLLWVRRHEPDVFSRVRRVLLPKDWLRLKLTGEAVSDPSDAAGTLWLNPATRDWDDVLLAACGLSRSHMPRLVEGSEVSAMVRPELAQAWGLSGSIPVAGGAGDNAASAVGIGAVAPGQGFISLGTSGVMFVVTDQFRPNPAQAVHAFCHTLPGRWHQMTVMLSAASALSWLTRLLGDANETATLAALERGDALDLDRAPIFLPYLAGERTPHNDVHVRGGLFGLDASHGALDITHAVLEGVAFGMAQGLAALREAGTEVSALGLVGGGAKSAYWAQLHADILNLEIHTYVGGSAGGALGAARLAQMACGRSEADVCAAPAGLRLYTPNAARGEHFGARFARYAALYPRIKSA